MPIFRYPSYAHKPNQATPIDPLDRDHWEKILHPRNLRSAEAEGLTDEKSIKEFKEYSPALSALEYPPDGTSRREAHAQRSWGLILDVDDKVVLSLDELKERLDGFLFVAFSSFSSTPETPRWRVVLPFAESAPVQYARSIWDYIDSAVFRGLSPVTRDPTRLGFYGRVRGERELASYQWHFNPGESFDWRPLHEQGLIQEETRTLSQILVPLSKDRRPHWTPRHTALAEATAFYRSKYESTEEGGRHAALFVASSQLWWDWAAEDEEFVFQVLDAVNNTFDPPKSQEDVEKEVEAGHKRTMEDGETQQNDYGVRREPPTPFSIEGVRALISNLKNRASRTQSEYSARMAMAADALKKAIDGKALCEYSNVPQLTHMYYHLAEGFPRNPTDSLMEFLGPSLAATRARLSMYPDVDGALNHDVVRARLQAFQSQALVRKDMRKKELEEEQKEELRSFFHSDRDWPYTEEEIERWEEVCGLTPKTWFLLYKKDFFIFNQGGYQGPKTAQEFSVMAGRWALPMQDVQVHIRNEKGVVKLKKIDEIVSEYGTVADRVEYDYGAKYSRVEWRPGNGTDVQGETVLTIAAGQKRVLERKYSHDIDQWIRLMSGDKYEMFLDYLAGFPQTAYALPCLYLYGPTGTGKSSFAKGLSRIYRRGEPLSYENATAKFNETVLDTPVVLCDEFIPEAVRKSGQTTAYLRNIVQKTDHMVEVKNGSFYTLKGALRIIITANNLSVITDDKEQLTNMDVAGTVNRFLLLEAAPETREFLEGLEAARFKEILDYDLAQHVLWLAENRTIDTSKRFLGIFDPNSQLKSAIVTTKEIPNIMCELLTTAILSNAKGVKGIKFDDEGLYVRQELWSKDTWEALRLEMPKISGGKMARGMALVAYERKAFWVGGKTVNYRKVDMDALMQWVQESQLVDPDEFKEALLRRMVEAEVLNGTNPTAQGPRETQ